MFTNIKQMQSQRKDDKLWSFQIWRSLQFYLTVAILIQKANYWNVICYAASVLVVWSMSYFVLFLDAVSNIFSLRELNEIKLLLFSGARVFNITIKQSINFITYEQTHCDKTDFYWKTPTFTYLFECRKQIRKIA